MQPLAAPAADILCTDLYTWQDSIDKGRLAHPAMTADKGHLVFKQVLDLFDAGAVLYAHGQNLIPYSLVDLFPRLVLLDVFFLVHIELIEDDDSRHVVHLTGYQETVDKALGSARLFDGGNKQGLVEVGGY